MKQLERRELWSDAVTDKGAKGPPWIWQTLHACFEINLEVIRIHDHDGDAHDRSDDTFCYKLADLDFSDLYKSPFERRVSSHCTRGFRAYRPRESRGYVAVSTVRAVASLGVALDVASNRQRSRFR